MKITKTINTATVTTAIVEAENGCPKIRQVEILLRSCDPLSDAKIRKAVRRIEPKATILSVDQHSDKYAIDIDDFVKVAHVEQ